MSDYDYGDDVLGLLYRVITTPGGEISISLLVGGQWLSGVAISARSWWTQMATMLRESGRASGVDEAFDAMGRLRYPTDDEVEAAWHPSETTTRRSATSTCATHGSIPPTAT